MPLLGTFGLALAALAVFASTIVLFYLSFQKGSSGSRSVPSAREQQSGKGGKGQEKHAAPMERGSLILVGATALALTLCVAIIVVCLLSGDNSLLYVAQNRSSSVAPLALLYKLSGLWAGREGSLLFWAWLISLFNAVVALRAGRRKDRVLDLAALAVAQLVLLVFLMLLLFDEASRPFVATPLEYLDANGALSGMASLWGMNTLLEHWAMAIHPPTLFVGYAGMTIPFAYAIATLITGDSSPAWIERASRYTLVSWLFLGIGIGLGAVWAYAVLSWGGYWAWDPVENASLLPWIVGVALVHSMTLYTQRGIFKRWTIMLACLTFAFVILGTFITRSGLVESVHAFSENLVAAVLFGILMFVPLLAGALLLLKAGKKYADEVDEGETENLISKDIAYFLNNVIIIVCALVLTYMTVAPALPAWLPLGNQALTPTHFDAIARPVGIVYALLIALGPLLGWRKTNRKVFLRQAWLPGLLALVLFAALCGYFATTLLPTYMHILAQGGTAAQELVDAGPLVYYAALTIVGFFAASLLFFNALILLVRALAKRTTRAQTVGGFVAHLAMGVLLVGLIGSSMYDSERTAYIGEGESFTLNDYTVSNPVLTTTEAGGDTLHTLTVDVERGGASLGQLAPQLEYFTGPSLQEQQMQHAAVAAQPLEDFYLVYRGPAWAGTSSTMTTDIYVLDIRVNPLISLVWIGFALLMLGTAIAALGKRR